MAMPTHKNNIIAWIDHRLPIFTFMRHELHEYLKQFDQNGKKK